MSEELKPCPFCGGNVAFHGSPGDDNCDGCHYIYCEPCGLLADFSKADPENAADTVDELRRLIIPHWNKRVMQKPSLPIGNADVAYMERMTKGTGPVSTLTQSAPSIYRSKIVGGTCYTWPNNVGGAEDL